MFASKWEESNLVLTTNQAGLVRNQDRPIAPESREKPEQIDAGRSAGLGFVATPPLPRSVIVSTLFINMLALGLPLTILQVYDRVLPNAALDTLAMLIVGLVGVLIIDVIMKLARYYLIGWTSAAFVHRASVEAFSRIMHAPPALVEKETVNIYANRMNNLAALGEFYGGPGRLLMIDIPSVAIFLLIMGIVGGSIVLIPLMMFAVFALLTYRRNLHLNEVIHEQSRHENRKYDFVIEVLSGIHTVKSMAMEPQMQRRFERLQRQAGSHNMNSIFFGGVAQANASLYTGISTVMIVSYGGVLAINGHMSVGALACCTLLSGQIIQPLLRGISVWTEMQNVRQKRNEAAKLFELPDVSSPDIAAETVTGGGISIRNLTFTYPETDAPVIDNLNLQVNEGEIIGLKGDDGSGRSTLIGLIHGDLHPDSGEILIGNMPVVGGTSTGLMKDVICVDQTPAIFRGTILENLTMFETGDAVLKARKAARLIGLDRDIQRYPDGYDMMLGEGVSGNIPAAFAQRIAIARALAKEPRVLILDEANTALDDLGEDQVVAALNHLRGTMTMLLISHRPSFLAISDRNFELKQGALQLVNSTATTSAKDVA